MKKTIFLCGLLLTFTALPTLAAPISLLAHSTANLAMKFTDFPPLKEMERQTIRNQGHRLDLLVRHDSIRRPVLVLLPGSVCVPIFMATKQDGQLSLSSSIMMPQLPNQQELGIHLALLERRNLVSLEHPVRSIGPDAASYVAEYPCSDHNGGITLKDRVQDTLTQLKYLRRQAWAGPILLAGFSEGSDVAAAVAAEHGSEVQSLLFLSGAGASQFFDFIHQQRNSGDAGGVAQIFSDLDSFLSGNPPATYLGSAADRWRSFAIDRTPLDTLPLSTVPVFIAHGDRDTSVPIASIDMLVTELMRKQPDRAIYYWPIPGADHSLRTEHGKYADKVYAAYVRWALGSPSGRTYHLDRTLTSTPDP